MITIRDIVEKRRRRWEERGDIEYDGRIVSSAVDLILDTPELRREVLNKPYLLIECAFSIVDKERRTVPFFLNEVQRDFIGVIEREGTSRPFFVLKGRQQGFTTLITAIQLSYSIVKRNFSGMTLADKSSNSVAIFNDKAKTVYDRLPLRLKPHEKFNSRNEMFFDRLNSSWRIDTATDQVGRSRTLSFLHMSEVAFYECSLSSLQAAINPAVVEGAMVVYESTANGFNEAKELWDSGSCVNLFYEWWRSPEYRIKDHSYLEYQDGWLEERKSLLYELGLDCDQVAWYCRTYKGYVDKSLIRQEFPCTPEEAFVASGSSIFNTEDITRQLLRLRGKTAGRVGHFEYDKRLEEIKGERGEILEVVEHIENIQFRESEDGYIILHEEPFFRECTDGTIERCPYVLGGDTAGTGEDYFTAKVISNMDGHTVATLRKQRMDEDLYAEQIYCLGRYYNDAFVGIEINYSMHPTRVLAGVYRYPNMYLRKRLDTNTDKVETEYGFNTTPKTRPVIVSELVKIMREDISLECDVNTLKEMATFVKKDNGRQEAIDGAHDDLVMALAIAHGISGDFTHSYIKDKPKTSSFIEENFNVGAEVGNGGYMDW